MAKVKAVCARVSVADLRELVTTWQDSESTEEVAARIGWKIEKVRTQAAKLRNKYEIPLKKFKRKDSDLNSEVVKGLKELCTTKPEKEKGK